MKIRAIVFIIMLLQSTGVVWAGNTSDKPHPTFLTIPAISISEALKISEGYVREKNIDVSQQYIHAIQLYYDSGMKRKGYYWRVQWIWSIPRMGSEYGLRVYMDKTVLPEPAGP